MKVDCKNPNSVKLFNTTLENKAYLNFSDDDIKEQINSYWIDFMESCSTEYDETVNKNINTAIKLIFDHKSTEEWIELLTNVEKVCIDIIFIIKFIETTIFHIL